MLKVVVIGSGNVAQHLITVFNKSEGTDLVQAYARTPKTLAHLLPPEKITDSYQNLQLADIYIIAVSDDAIPQVSASLPFDTRLVVHTSGSTGLEQLNAKNKRGVFYPLQTFSKNKQVNFNIIPICLESEYPGDFSLLETLAKCISGNVYKIDSKQRQALHVAAVFVSNFTNHMYKLGSDICNENNIPFEILKPLIAETADKIMHLSPENAQTGPAVRLDKKTIEKHLDFIKEENKRNIYKTITESIQNVKKL